jgi:hypothetical protein
VRTVSVATPTEHILEGLYYDYTPEGKPRTIITQCQQCVPNHPTPCDAPLTHSPSHSLVFLAAYVFPTGPCVFSPRHQCSTVSALPLPTLGMASSASRPAWISWLPSSTTRPPSWVRVSGQWRLVLVEKKVGCANTLCTLTP